MFPSDQPYKFGNSAPSCENITNEYWPPIFCDSCQEYDFASNMSGNNNGLRAKVLSENSKALYLCCLGHQLNFVVQDALVTSGYSWSPKFTRENECCLQFIKNSPKKWQTFQTIKEESNNY